MGINKEQLVASSGSPKHHTCGESIDRRRFLRLAAGTGAMVQLGSSAFAWAQDVVSSAAQSGHKTKATDSRLPDGTEHVSWEQPLIFSKTYYVDNTSARADDNGPGSKTRPFRTISRAAQVLEPGQRVVIASGTYRECVRPMRGGSGPGQMISYEAAPGAMVFIKGSEILKEGWQQRSVSMRRFGPATQEPSPVTVWQYDLTGGMFPDAYNPFALASAPADRAWLDTRSVDMGPYFRRRGLVFVDGKPLEPVEQRRELASARLGGRRRRVSHCLSPVCLLARGAVPLCRRSGARPKAGSG